MISSMIRPPRRNHTRLTIICKCYFVTGPKPEIQQAFADGTGAQFPPILTVAQLAALLQIGAVIAFTGMRPGELQRLRVEDVDLENNWIYIVSRPGAETKTGHSRKVPIHANLKPYLEKQLLLKTGQEGPWFFTAPPSKKCPQDGRQIDTKELNADFLLILAAVGVTTGYRKGGFSIRSLRNSFETMCVNAGIPQRVVDTWLGHRSDRSMASIYYKLPDEDSQRFMLNVP
jgi:integrase